MYVRVGKTVYERTDCPRQVKTPPPQKQAAGAKASPARKSPRPPKAGNKITARASQRRKPPVKPRPAAKLKRKRIVVGDVFASSKPAEVSTTLGSCVAVCLFDSDSRYGGMNHFALPSGDSCSRNVASFGIHAMELLINEIMTMGGDRRSLKAKVFGGAHVVSLPGESCIGERNGQFIRDFLETESIPIAAKYLGGDRGMQVVFETHTGRARLKLLDKSSAINADRDLEKVQTAPAPEPVSDITLF
jgi:chemotaxis receptor (MCP) glutamine deamidase CheD